MRLPSPIKRLQTLIKQLLNGKISNPLTQNFMIYTISYVLSALLSSIPSLGLFAPEGVAVPLLQSLADCILPTTVTLTVGTMIQNLAQTCEVRALTIWSPLSTIVFVLIYASYRHRSAQWLPYISIAFAVLNGILNLWTIVKIQEEVNTHNTGEDQRQNY